VKRQKRHNEGAGLPAPSSIPAPCAGSDVRIRMTRQAVGPLGYFEAGKTYRVPAAVAEKWIAAGLAYEDKSLDGPPETK